MEMCSRDSDEYSLAGKQGMYKTAGRPEAEMWVRHWGIFFFNFELWSYNYSLGTGELQQVSEQESDGIRPELQGDWSGSLWSTVWSGKEENAGVWVGTVVIQEIRNLELETEGETILLWDVVDVKQITWLSASFSVTEVSDELTGRGLRRQGLAVGENGIGNVGF